MYCGLNTGLHATNASTGRSANLASAGEELAFSRHALQPATAAENATPTAQAAVAQGRTSRATPPWISYDALALAHRTSQCTRCLPSHRRDAASDSACRPRVTWNSANRHQGQPLGLAQDE